MSDEKPVPVKKFKKSDEPVEPALEDRSCIVHFEQTDDTQDFDGQQRAEHIYEITILAFALVGFIWGYLCQHFSQTIYIVAAGFVLSCILTLPPWPMYRKKPLKWQPARDFDTEND